MAIMTGVQSAQVLGPSTQKQADKSRQELKEVDSKERERPRNPAGKFGGAHSGWRHGRGGQNNGLDVIGSCSLATTPTHPWAHS